MASGIQVVPAIRTGCTNRRILTKDDIHLDIFLKLDSTYEAVYTPLKHTAGITSLKTDDARGDFLWRTEETILSVRFGQIAGIC